MNSYLLLGAASLVIARAIKFYISRSQRPFADIPGPVPTSWLFGNMLELIQHAPYGKHEFTWQRQYGPVYSIKGCIGEDRLMVSDPTALRHILADTGDFRKSPQHQLVNKSISGDAGILYVQGSEHRRLRHIMLPSFSTDALRLMVPNLQEIAEELRVKWQQSLQSNLEATGIIDMYPEIHETALKAVTQCIVGYDMPADNAYTTSYRNIVAAGAKRSKIAILTHSVLLALPNWVFSALAYFPPHDFATMLDFRKMSDRRSRVFLKRKIEARELGVEAGEGKSLFDVMRELSCANTIIWALYELSRNPGWQERLRNEINAAHEYSKAETPEFYDRIPFLNALIKEVVRFYSGVPYTERIAVRDTILPISTAITSRSGKKVTEIPVKKGQYVEVAISSYNRLSTIWGEDAEQFNPLRWFDERAERNFNGALGPYANLLTFFGGPRACIGWRFAVLEMQIVLCDLIRHACFGIPESNNVVAAHAISLVPLQMGDKEHIGLPLKVSLM
ncbi:hypothetical protein D9619_008306 [Psilocybe cf. subviscida]|uniref:Cytochrome P450 n=1 Tax=Psilocybe cf. subviscida TaxID=2480587 RepID=A0A8H5B9N9_9AGAR|nr:hypothetical protein D9619_008306 [Psilocybe cf. subviscida]